MARRSGPSFRALLFRCGEGAVQDTASLFRSSIVNKDSHTSSVPSSPCLSNKKTEPRSGHDLKLRTNYAQTQTSTHFQKPTPTPTPRRTHYTHQTTPQIRPISASMQGPPCSGVYKHIYVAPVQGSAPCPGDYSSIRSLSKLSSMMQKRPRTTGVGGRGRSPFNYLPTTGEIPPQKKD